MEAFFSCAWASLAASGRVGTLLAHWIGVDPSLGECDCKPPVGNIGNCSGGMAQFPFWRRSAQARLSVRMLGRVIFLVNPKSPCEIRSSETRCGTHEGIVACVAAA